MDETQETPEQRKEIDKFLLHQMLEEQWARECENDMLGGDINFCERRGWDSVGGKLDNY